MSESEPEDEDLSVQTAVVRERTKFSQADTESSDEDLSAPARYKVPAKKTQRITSTAIRVISTPIEVAGAQEQGFNNNAIAEDTDVIHAESVAAHTEHNTTFSAKHLQQPVSTSVELEVALLQETQDLHPKPSTASCQGVKEKPLFDGQPNNPKRDILLGLEDDKTTLPGCTAQWLRPYQIDGILFMYDLYTTKTGGILGDDMGLGKTVQVIGLLNAVFGKDGSQRDWKRMREMRAAGEEYPVVMIICPGTLIDNWLKELETWSWTHVAKYHGPDKDIALQTIRSGRAEVLITTYNTYKTNEFLLNQISWNVVIADECHIIKEKRSQITQSANLVNSHCRIGLTGTAIQNNYDELYTLLNWTNPGVFGTPSDWVRNVSTVLKNGQKHTATNYELSLARKKALELSKNLLPRVLLRRTKALIAHQLPKKTDKVVFCPLTSLQITAYDNLMLTDDLCFLRDAKQPCTCGSGLLRQLCCYKESPSGKTFAEMLFPYLHYLRNLSNHMALCLPRTGEADWKRARSQDLLEQALPEDWRAIINRPPMQNGCDPELCGKWKVLQKLLLHWKREGSKVLIFSSSVKLLDMLNDLMMQENYLYEYLHGSMSLEARAMAVDNFNNNKEQFVFLISTRAGGVGLNIVSANKVVIFDPNWNPAHDLQAQDRAYRIGQRRDVEVYRLISTGTVEEVVYARQVYKQQQANIGYDASEERRYFRGVQGDADQRGELFGVENLLTFHGENHVLKAIFDDTEEAESHFDNIRMANIDINATQEDIRNVDVKDAFGIESIVKAECPAAGTITNPTTTEPSSKNEDVIAQILASAGVRYSHKNNEVVGRSRIETEIGKLAAEAAGNAEHQNREAYLATILNARHRQRKRPVAVDPVAAVSSRSVAGPRLVQSTLTNNGPDGREGRDKKRARVLPWTKDGVASDRKK
ncbi:protein of unknown function [Taphrina deformans PYCC 5710]|uniref:Uncharacterized protein n=1 Tax=Taphrina deformans (strain PYCC 5710 / ATCC 11124 / CBS 356.35 / IMI 108563 / JCM 9778 / NBRC 8474) TaxID=1097556 RepID=R4XFJ5_TAPDE|nr:protein of unknown function [Taphrina deformans PYCC 5710]|eukprot:CCG84448.1 protein of unknown function [Taphrina deformans PYCC 5710]